MDFRQRVVDAAIAELQHQVGPQYMETYGSTVRVDDSFKLARLAEAIIKAALAADDDILEEVARNIAPDAHNWQGHREQATDAMLGALGAILAKLDPLP